MKEVVNVYKYNNSNEVGEVLRNRRIELGLSQQALSNLIGVSKSNVSQYESGGWIPSNVRVVKKIKDVMGLMIIDRVVVKDLRIESKNNC